MRVADYIIDFLYKKGVDTIFTLAGGGAMYLNDATVCHKKIKYICCHHEQAAALAAEAYAKTKNSLGAVMVTSGPGSTNAVTGLLEAYQNSIPVIFLSSQAKKSQMIHFSGVSSLRQFGVQEVDIIPIVKPLTKYAAIIEKPEDVKEELEKAYTLALSGRPGPVWLDIPPDVAASEIDPLKLRSGSDKNIVRLPVILKSSLNILLDYIQKSNKPIIIAGGGIRLSGGIREFYRLLKLLKIPVIVPDMGLDLLEYDNPYYIGHGGIRGDRAANIIIQNADLLISIGSRLSVPFIGHEYDKWSPNSYKFVIDIDKDEHRKKTIKIDTFIHADAKDFINQFIQAYNPKININKNHIHWLKKCNEIKKRYSLFSPEKVKNKNEINMYHAIWSISKFSKPKDIFITDAGVTAYICAQTIKYKKDQRMIIPGATLTMGYNLPAILGIWAAEKKADVICITGDGSLQLNVHELATIARYKIPAKIFVINNHGYLAIRTTQKNFFNGRLIGEGPKTGVFIPETEKLAKAYGINFYRLNNTLDLNKKIPQILNQKNTAICEIVCPEWQDILGVSSKKTGEGKLISLPMDEMFPFLPDEETENIRKELE